MLPCHDNTNMIATDMMIKSKLSTRQTYVKRYYLYLVRTSNNYLLEIYDLGTHLDPSPFLQITWVFTSSV